MSSSGQRDQPPPRWTTREAIFYSRCAGWRDAARDGVVNASFGVPTQPSCDTTQCGSAVNQWRKSPHAFSSRGHGVRMLTAPNVCACVIGRELRWSLPPHWRNVHDLVAPGSCDRANHTVAHHAGLTMIARGVVVKHPATQLRATLPMLQAAALLGSSSRGQVRTLQLQFVSAARHLLTRRVRNSVTESADVTPIARGVAALYGRTLAVTTLGAGERVCFEEAAFSTAETRWTSMRVSRLQPACSTDLPVPTAAFAAQLAARARAHCGLAADATRRSAERSCRRPAQPPLTVHLLVRSSRQAANYNAGAGHERSFVNTDGVLRTLREVGLTVKIVTTDDLTFCSQVRWLDADVVLTAHGSHMVAQAFMRAAQHIIEVMPYLYEQDAGFLGGCAPRQRHVLAGQAQNLTLPAKASAQWRHREGPRIAKRAALGAEACQDHFSCRVAARGTKILVPLDELRVLLQRIKTGTTAEGRYQCNAFRCAYR